MFHCTLLFCILMYFNLTWDLKFYEAYKKKHQNSYICLHLKNKLKIHNFAIFNYKCSVKKTAGQWTYIYVQGDQRVKEHKKCVRPCSLSVMLTAIWYKSKMIFLEFNCPFTENINSYILCMPKNVFLL